MGDKPQKDKDMGKKLKAFTGTPISKERLLFHLKEHQKMDAFEKGHYGEKFEISSKNFKGCAVGCSLRSVALELGIEISTSAHSLYEKYLGIPRWLAYVEDRVFEGLPLERSKNWPLEFAKAVNVGADLDKVRAPFLIFVLESCLEPVQDKNHYKQKKAIEKVINLYKRKGKVGAQEWRKVAAADAAAAAADAAADAADAAAAADAARAAATAAYAAAYAARAADAAACAAAVAAYADAAADAAAAAAAAAADAAAADAAEAVHDAAARAAHDAAAAARAVNDAVADAYTAAYEKFADKLLELMRNCK